MKIHPIFVHFPIALLITYAMVEILPLKRWFSRIHWDSVKTFLVFFGTIGAVAAAAAGDIDEKSLALGLRNILEVHKFFAATTTLVFGVLSAAYILRWAFQEYPQLFTERFRFLSFVRQPLRWISDLILIRWITVSLALVGLIAVSITGALGGIMVYGVDADPFGKFIYSLFFG